MCTVVYDSWRIQLNMIIFNNILIFLKNYPKTRIFTQKHHSNQNLRHRQHLFFAYRQGGISLHIYIYVLFVIYQNHGLKLKKCCNSTLPISATYHAKLHTPCALCLIAYRYVSTHMNHLGVEKALIYLSLSTNFWFWVILKFTHLKLSLNKVSENFCLGVYML